MIFDWYGRFHLYNIQKDPFEKNDLASELIDVRESMFKKLMTWLTINVEKRYWPQINPKYNPKKESRKESFQDLFSAYITENKIDTK